MWIRKIRSMVTGPLVVLSLLGGFAPAQAQATKRENKDCLETQELRTIYAAIMKIDNDEEKVPNESQFGSTCKQQQTQINNLIDHLALHHRKGQGGFQKELSTDSLGSCPVTREYRVFRRFLMENGAQLDEDQYPLEIAPIAVKSRRKKDRPATCRDYSSRLKSLRQLVYAAAMGQQLIGGVSMHRFPNAGSATTASNVSLPEQAPKKPEEPRADGAQAPVAPAPDSTPVDAQPILPSVQSVPSKEQPTQERIVHLRPLASHPAKAEDAVEAIGAKRARYAPQGEARPERDDLTLADAKKTFIDFGNSPNGTTYGLVFDECKDLFEISNSNPSSKPTDFSRSGKVGLRITDKDGAGRACMKQLIDAKARCGHDGNSCSRLSTLPGAKIALVAPGGADGEAKFCYDNSGKSDREPWACDSFEEPMKFEGPASIRARERAREARTRNALMKHYKDVVSSPLCRQTEEGLDEVETAVAGLVAMGEKVKIDLNRDRLKLLEKECLAKPLDEYETCLEKLRAWADSNPEDADKVADLFGKVAARFTPPGKPSRAGLDIASSILSEAQLLPVSEPKARVLANYMEFDIPVAKCQMAAAQGWGRNLWGQPTNQELLYCGQTLVPYFLNRKVQECSQPTQGLRESSGIEPTSRLYAAAGGPPPFAGPSVPSGCNASDMAVNKLVETMRSATVVDQQRVMMQQQSQQMMLAAMNGGGQGQPNMQAFGGGNPNANLMAQAQTPSLLTNGGGGNFGGNTSFSNQPFWNAPYNTTGVPYGSNYNPITPLSGYGAYGGPIGGAGSRPFGT